MSTGEHGSWNGRIIAIGIAVLVSFSSCDLLVGSDSSGAGGQDDAGGGSAVILDGGEISGTYTDDLTLERNTRYSVTGNVTMQATLTIEPGAILEFDDDTYLLIDDAGLIRAIETASNPIIFRGATETAGFWRGVLVYSDNAQNRLEHVEISHTGSGQIGGKIGAVVLDGFNTGRMALAHVSMTTGLGHGLVVEDEATLVEMSNGTFGDLASTPILITPNHVAALDSASSFLPSNGDNRVEIDASGVLDSDATWPNPGVPYFVNEELDIQGALTIEDGSRFEFGASVRMEIDPGGALIADASGGERIVFTGAEQTPGYWRGIQIESDDTRNVMDYVEVSYAGELNGFAGSEEGNVYLYGGGSEDAYLQLRNSTISNGASHGVSYDSDTTLTDDGTNTIVPFASVTMTNIGDDLSGSFSDYYVP
jgi:hypothetical protein